MSQPWRSRARQAQSADPQGPGAAAVLEAFPTAKTESIRSTSAAPHRGQGGGVRSTLTRVSNRSPQLVQRYSKMGIVRPEPERRSI